MTIPHPSVENLLRTHGTDAAGRKAARQELVETAEAWARNEARVLALSLNCEQDVRNRAVHHRCCNDGSTCLCECHDPVEAGGAG